MFLTQYFFWTKEKEKETKKDKCFVIQGQMGFRMFEMVNISLMPKYLPTKLLSN